MTLLHVSSRPPVTLQTPSSPSTYTAHAASSALPVSSPQHAPKSFSPSKFWPASSTTAASPATLGERSAASSPTSLTHATSVSSCPAQTAHSPLSWTPHSTTGPMAGPTMASLSNTPAPPTVAAASWSLVTCPPMPATPLALQSCANRFNAQKP